MSKCWGLDIAVLQSGMAAAAHFLTKWRKALVKHLNKDLKLLAEAQFTDLGPYLFGEDFGKQAADISVQYKKSLALFFSAAVTQTGDSLHPRVTTRTRAPPFSEPNQSSAASTHIDQHNIKENNFQNSK